MASGRSLLLASQRPSRRLACFSRLFPSEKIIFNHFYTPLLFFFPSALTCNSNPLLSPCQTRHALFCLMMIAMLARISLISSRTVLLAMIASLEHSGYISSVELDDNSNDD